MQVSAVLRISQFQNSDILLKSWLIGIDQAIGLDLLSDPAKCSGVGFERSHIMDEWIGELLTFVEGHLDGTTFSCVVGSSAECDLSRSTSLEVGCWKGSN